MEEFLFHAGSYNGRLCVYHQPTKPPTSIIYWGGAPADLMVYLFVQNRNTRKYTIYMYVDAILCLCLIPFLRNNSNLQIVNINMT